MSKAKVQKINTVPNAEDQFFAGKPDDPNLWFFAGTPDDPNIRFFAGTPPKDFCTRPQQQERAPVPSASTHDLGIDVDTK